jgi:hypothetical protein
MIVPSRIPEPQPLTVHEIRRHPQDGWSLADPVKLSSGSERALGGVVRALLPPPPAPRPADIEARVTTHVRVMLQYMPAALRLGFILMMHLLEWSPLWRFSAFSKLSKLPAERGSRILAGIASSRLAPLRMMMLAPKAIVLSAYFDQDEVHAALDYEPRSFIQGRIARRNELLTSGALDDPGKRPVRLEVLP